MECLLFCAVCRFEEKFQKAENVKIYSQKDENAEIQLRKRLRPHPMPHKKDRDIMVKSDKRIEIETDAVVINVK